MPFPLSDASMSRDGAPTVVLLVDDQRFVGLAVGQLLAGESDLELHFCDRAADAIPLANQIDPTVILQDLMMPDGDGLALMRLFHLNPLTARTPVVVLSGNDDAATRASALAEGAADYLVKLPSQADLIACIRRYARGPVREQAALDPDVFYSIMDGRPPEFMRLLSDQFVAEAGSGVDRLRDAAERGDRAALVAGAHSLKGSAGIIGAQQLAVCCGEIEQQLAGTRDGGGTAALIDKLARELVRVREALALATRKSGP